MEAQNLERSKVIQQQKQQRQELEKKIKKLKGAMKEAAQKELEELDAKHDAEIKEFDINQGLASSEKPAEKPAEAAPVTPPAGNFRERNWNGLSKTELEQECSERGLSKKGKKDDLIQKLIIFHQELKIAAAKAPAPEAKPSFAPAPREAKTAELDEEEDEEEEDEDEDDDEEDDDDAEEVDAEEAERQFKREKAIRKAIQFLLKEKCKEGFPIEELPAKLETVKVQGFTPEKCGYKTLEKFVRGQPDKVLRYRKKTKMILPPTLSAASTD
jgi:hypothetical protein